MDFDRARLMNNISTLIKERGRKMGELEDAVGVSKGYLSKMSKPENETMPGVDLIYRLAQELDVSMDMLIRGNFQRSNDNLFYMIRFLNQLKNDTDSHNLTWLLEDLFDKSKNCNPRIKLSHYENEKGIREPAIQYMSPFLPDQDLNVDGNTYYAQCDEFGTLYLMSLKKDSKNEKFFDLFAVTSSEYEITPVCCTLLDPGLNGTMLDLYNCIERHDKDLKINAKAEKLMSVYLNNHSDEVPFE